MAPNSSLHSYLTHALDHVRIYDAQDRWNCFDVLTHLLTYLLDVQDRWNCFDATVTVASIIGLILSWALAAR